MTRPPLKPSRRAVVVGLSVGAAGLIGWIGLASRTSETPALKAKRTLPTLGDFNDPRYTPSEPVPREDLLGPLKAEGFADAIGVQDGVPVVATELKCIIAEPGPNGRFNATVHFKGKAVRIPITDLDGPGPPTLRAVSDGSRFVVFVDCCGSGIATVFDGDGKSTASLFVGGHAHTKGCIAPRRGLLFATRFEADQSGVKDKKAESEILVMDMEDGEEMGFLRMPGSQFDCFAVSKDEQWLYVGFGDGSIRKFRIDDHFPPRKRRGRFGF